jgi:hypothetical protein
MRYPLFVFGFPRSGTTLLRSVIGQHSKIRLFNEPELILALRHAGYSAASRFEKEDRKRLLSELGQIGLCGRHIQRLPEKILAEFLDGDQTFSFSDVYERLLPRPDGNHILWGEKSNNNVFFVRDLSVIYTHAIFIHIIRDVRSAVLSYYKKKMHRKSKNSLGFPATFSVSWFKTIGYFAQKAALWERWLAVARESKEHVAADSWIEIRFEDFLDNPRRHLQKVCDYANLTFEESMLDSALRRSDPVLFTDAAYAHKKLSHKLDKSRARSFEHLPSALLWTTERYAGKMMRHVGYELTEPELPARERMAIRLFLAGYDRKLRSSLKSHLSKRGLTFR